VVPGIASTFARRLRSLRKAASATPLSCTHVSVAEAKEPRREVCGYLPEDALIANVGAGTRRYGPNVINVEVEPVSGVDLVGVAEKLPLADSSCDGAVLQAVLEHVRNADLTLRERLPSTQAGRVVARRSALHTVITPSFSRSSSQAEASESID
jgi:Methyltransferase domain